MNRKNVHHRPGSAALPTAAVAEDSPESSPSTLPSISASDLDAAAPGAEPPPAPGFDAPELGRSGKIARLPKSIRDELNRRLFNGEPGPKLLDWLNHEPQVQVVLQALFAGKPINLQNLSHWRTGGFREWVAQQQMLQRVQSLAESAQELSPRSARALTEHLSVRFVAGCLLDLPSFVQTEAHPPAEIKRIEQIVALLTHLRRSDHQAAKLHLERERLALAKRRVRHATLIAKRKPLREVTMADYRAVFGIPDPEDEPNGVTAQSDLPEPGSSEDAAEVQPQDES